MAVQPDMIALVVKDVGASLAFYRTLGLSISDGQENEPFVEIKANGYRLSWNSAEMVKADRSDLDGPVRWRADGAGVQVRFRARGGCDVQQNHRGRILRTQRAVGRLLGQRYAIVVNPDGNHISLFASLANAGTADAVRID